MTFLESMEQNVQVHPDAPACAFTGKSTSYRQLWEASDRIAAKLLEYFSEREGLVGVTASSPNWMTIACFLACLKVGLGYLPLSEKDPAQRLEQILTHSEAGIVLETTVSPLPTLSIPTVKQVVSLGDLTAWVEDATLPLPAAELTADHRPAYCLFTSGSTGVPKGVLISRHNLDCFLTWAVPLVGNGLTQPVFLNQAPLTFDLSVLPLYAALVSGGCFWQLPEATQPGDLVRSLAQSQGAVWVSTPSFATLCLGLPGFSPEYLPQLRRFFFCGEELRQSTAQKLAERFPQWEIINSYGPTEATVAVTAVSITPRMLGADCPLPVGTPQPGVKIALTEDEEILILGDTVALGYCDPVQTQRSFFVQNGLRGYHTGDRGSLVDGMLYWNGRLDRQIKHRGYRIEPEEIERQLAAIPGITGAAVLASGAKVSRLYAFYSSSTPYSRQQLRELLAKQLPAYLLPTHFRPLKALPLTKNGKIDLAQLKEMLT